MEQVSNLRHRSVYMCDVVFTLSCFLFYFLLDFLLFFFIRSFFLLITVCVCVCDMRAKVRLKIIEMANLSNDLHTESDQFELNISYIYIYTQSIVRVAFRSLKLKKDENRRKKKDHQFRVTFLLTLSDYIYMPTISATDFKFCSLLRDASFLHRGKDEIK